MDSTLLSSDEEVQVVPATPQTHHAALPQTSSQLPAPPVPTSPSSMLVPSLDVNTTLSDEINLDNNPLPAINASSQRSKYLSPTPPVASMTPPPSTQPPKRVASPMNSDGRTISPSTNALNYTTTVGSAAMAGQLPLDTASAAELRDMLAKALQDNSRLDAAAREARMSAAHYKLQHSLLLIESEDQHKRLEVEYEMMRRELEVLQAAENSRRETSPELSPQMLAMSTYIEELKAFCETMERENSKLRRRLERAKGVIADKEDEIHDLEERNKQYLERIRQNREHMHLLTSPGGVFASPQSQHSLSIPRTPHYQPTPNSKRTPISARLQAQQLQQQQFGVQLQHAHQQHRNQGSQDNFAALLMADRVLHNNTNQQSSPTTPASAQRVREIPLSAQYGPPHARHNQLLPPAQLIPLMPRGYMPDLSDGGYGRAGSGSAGSPASMGVVSPPVKKQKEKRRRSTDSTVSEEADTERRKHAAVSTVVPRSYRGSAPRAARPSSGDSTEDEADSNDRDRDSEASTIHEDEVQASQASLTASAMLRMDNSRSVDLAASPPSQQQQPRSYHYAGQPQPEVKERGGDQQQLQFGQHQQSHTRTALPVGTVQGAAQKGRILQSKIFGAVSKAGVQRDDKLGEDGKRKRLPTDEEVRAKRLRTAAQEGLGLGISGV